MSEPVLVETVEGSNEFDSLATPEVKQKPKVKVPTSAPAGRTSKVGKVAKKKRTSTSLSPTPPPNTGKLKKGNSQKKLPKAPLDDWSISSKEDDEKSEASMDIKAVAQGMPAPPLTKVPSKKSTRPSKLTKRESSKTAMMTSGDTTFMSSGGENTFNSSERSPSSSKRKTFKREGSSNVSNGGASRKSASAHTRQSGLAPDSPTPPTPQRVSSASPGTLKRRGRSSTSVMPDGSVRSVNRSSTSPMPDGARRSVNRSSTSPMPDGARRSVNRASTSPMRDGARRSVNQAAASPSAMKSPVAKRRTMEGAPMTPRMSSSRSPQRPRQSAMQGSTTPLMSSSRSPQRPSQSAMQGSTTPRRSVQVPDLPLSTPGGNLRSVSSTPSAARRSVQNSPGPMTPGRQSKTLSRGSMIDPPPLTPGKRTSTSPPRRISSMGPPAASPGSLRASLQTTARPSLGSLQTTSRRSMMSPKSPSNSRRSTLGGRRATTGIEASVDKLDLDDDDKPEVSNVINDDPGEEEVVEQKGYNKMKEKMNEFRKTYPKTDEDWDKMEKPPKSLLVVWCVVLLELVFDLGTTMIALRALDQEDDCCGYPITIGVFPVLITAPFFALVSSEIALLLRAILLTVWPNLMKPVNLDRWNSDFSEDDDDDEGEKDEEMPQVKENDEENKLEKFEEESDATNIEQEEKVDDTNIEQDENKVDETNIEHDGENVGEEHAPAVSKEEEVGKEKDTNKRKPWISELTKRRMKRFCIQYGCCWLRWKARFLMYCLDFMVLVNPFFGCFIAWVLMYQSNKSDAFSVLGLEAASLTLHYISVYLEGGISTIMGFFLQGVLPMIPFSVAIALVLYYLKQGGVCYIVEEKVFKFTGCEVCVDGYPPVDGICFLKNGTNYTFVATDFLALDSYSSVEAITYRSNQVSYCADENPQGPEDINFCFFDFEYGKLDGLVANATEAPTFLPTTSSNKCGATAGPGNWELNCVEDVWNPTQDASLYCFAFGGAGDACHLSIVNDGSNYGRFKDPTPCGLKVRNDGHYYAYGDVLYLWDDPSLYGFDVQWASNAWLAYSLTRWQDEMELARNRGLRVSTPLITFQSLEQVQNQLDVFFAVCSPDCEDPESNAFIDVLAVNVFCDPVNENCQLKAKDVASSLITLSSLYSNRPVHITQWGVRDSRVASELLSAMDSMPEFFVDNDVIERVYWYSGNDPDNTNLRIEARDRRLGLILSETCRDIV